MYKFYIIFCLVLSLHNLNYSECFLYRVSPTISNKYPDTLGIQRTISDLNEARDGKLLVTNLDYFRNLLVIARHLSLRLVSGNIDELIERQRIHGKLQDLIPDSVRFPCNTMHARSAQPPTSVHRVRPGDVDIIASLGDSLSAGNGILSESITHILNEHRGISFAGGGLDTWRHFLTLPNILKVFNPQLYGYSTADGLTVDESSHLNIAEPMIMSRDLPFQVRTFIGRIEHDPNIDVQLHWKLLTIFVGNNDICSDMCHHTDEAEFLQRHELDLREALTLLRENVPRLIVNLVPVPNMVTTLYTMRNIPFVCDAVHLIGCHCVFSERIKGEKLRDASNTIERWQAIEEYIAALEEYQTDDFTVIFQPFTANISLATLPDGNTDLRYFSSDCFHFSQRGHAAMANMLWNNMLQPINFKKHGGKLTLPFEQFLCPTAERPFLATWKNSLAGFNN